MMDDEEMGFNGFEWDNDCLPDFRPRGGGDFRNKRYNDAYGDYRGGYGPPRFRGPPGPPLGFGPSFGFPPRPMFMWGRGFGPGGPPMKRSPHEDRAIKYLMRCGATKESVKNLPKDLLQNIEPHYCGICGQNFDSFSMSRLHYISKNHLKTQKRWLSQKSEMGPNKKEVPFRSRELYCELCDVQITSKVHAESHYSGKPHRAIVNGRKNPKNPMLLQPDMDARLEQLIRREKRYLKNIVEENTEESPKESKPTAGELYCDICKTSVTCTEQMTMHLNGKRHLNKEKQHIFKMMKGGIPENQGNLLQSCESNKDSEEGAGAVEDDKSQEEENFDWGNGSGNWDEPSTEGNNDADQNIVA